MKVIPRAVFRGLDAAAEFQGKSQYFRKQSYFEHSIVPLHKARSIELDAEKCGSLRPLRLSIVSCFRITHICPSTF